MLTSLLLASGLCWSAVYLLIIQKGLAGRTYGMPVAALGANLAWEFIFSFQRPPELVAQHVVNIVWFVFDLIILGTVVWFGAREFDYLPRWMFNAGLAATLVLAYLGVDLISREFDNGGPTYVAFGQNLMMSALFLGMLATRRSLRGQSLSIAVLKLVGTACASVWIGMYGEHQGSSLLLGLFVGIFVLDLAYAAAVLAVSRGWRSEAVRRAPRTVGQSGLHQLSDALNTATVPKAQT